MRHDSHVINFFNKKKQNAIIFNLKKKKTSSQNKNLTSDQILNHPPNYQCCHLEPNSHPRQTTSATHPPIASPALTPPSTTPSNFCNNFRDRKVMYDPNSLI